MRLNDDYRVINFVIIVRQITSFELSGSASLQNNSSKSIFFTSDLEEGKQKTKIWLYKVVRNFIGFDQTEKINEMVQVSRLQSFLEHEISFNLTRGIISRRHSQRRQRRDKNARRIIQFAGDRKKAREITRQVALMSTTSSLSVIRHREYRSEARYNTLAAPTSLP